MHTQNRVSALSRLLMALLACLWFATGAVSAQGQAQGAPAHEHDADGHDHADHDDEHGHEDADHDHDHGHEDADHDDHDHDAAGVAGIRLLLGQAGGSQAYVVSAQDGTVLGTFSVPGASSVQQLADTRYGALVHTDANRVTFVYSGLSAVDHGNHMDLLLGNPYVLATINTGRQPIHFVSMGNDIAVFNDADGTAAWFDSRLLGASIDYETITASAPDHGSLVPLDGYMALGLYSANSLEVRDENSVLRATFPGCDAVHGQARLGGRAVFACANGVMVVRQLPGGVFTASLLPNPAGSQDRVSHFEAAGAEQYVVGNFGTGFAVVDPVALTFATYRTEGTQLGGALFEDGERFARLGSDGRLRSFDLATGRELGSVAVVDELLPGAVRPAITAAGDLAFVTDPTARAVVVVDLHTMTVTDRLALDFRPDGIALLQLPGAVLH